MTGAWAISKSSDPASGSTVQPGSTITYTVTATKLEGVDPQDVIVNDNLSGVLNHATVVPGSVTPSVGTAAIDGDTLTWQIPALGGEETVTYQVLVDQDAYGVTLANAVTSPGSSACPPDAKPVKAAALDPGCPTTTKHFTPAWSLKKSSDPASGSTVDPGSRITYTLTVTNTSDGTLDGATVTDDLTEVLAHASLVAVPDGATLTGNSLVWTVPTLSTRDETATLSYTVVVDADATSVRLRNVATPGAGGTCGVCTTTHRTVPPGTPPGSVPPETPPGSVPPGTPPGNVPPGTPPGNVPPGNPPGIVPPGGLLPNTGGPGLVPLGLGLGLIAGAGLILGIRNRRKGRV